MFDFLDKLRQKPDKVKKRIALLISFAVVGIIFVIWLSVIYPNFRQSEMAKADAASTTPSPISSFSDTFSSGLSALSDQFSKIKEALSALSVAPVYYATTAPASTTSNQ